jgi:hypothetical protein
VFIRIDVCDRCHDGTHVRLSAKLEGDEVPGTRSAPSLDLAIAVIASGIASAVVACLGVSEDLKTERDVDEMWDLMRALAAYQLRVQKALHFRVTAPGSTLMN